MKPDKDKPDKDPKPPKPDRGRPAWPPGRDPATPVWWYREIWPGDEGDDVLIIQRKLGCEMTGVMDDRTIVRIRGLQRKHGLEESGIVSKDTADKLGEKESKGREPEWFTRSLEVGDDGEDVTALRKALRAPLKPTFFDHHLEQAVRRFQSSVGLKPTGKVTKRTAVELGDRTA